mmetsp:Transcript_95398/g.307497  ORF Transcript_95398/g.307497 Transcript_95398/m.307497 type:complete len:101 (-) Transcript_95398:12-314(-)
MFLSLSLFVLLFEEAECINIMGCFVYSSAVEFFFRSGVRLESRNYVGLNETGHCMDQRRTPCTGMAVTMPELPSVSMDHWLRSRISCTGAKDWFCTIENV